MTRIEGYIGCAACKTVLFRIDSVERAGAKANEHTGIFEHQLAPLTDPEAGSHLKCACGANLERVPDPNVSRETA